jgi:hypothetical protein
MGAAVTVAGVLALALSGCVGAPTPTPTATASSSAEPIFASDEEALAAATEAYERYRSVSATVTAEGGVDAERIDPTVTSDYAMTLHEEFAALAEAGLTIVGATRVHGATLAESAYDEQGATVSIYFCRDVGSVRVLGADGSDVTPADRDDTLPTQAYFVSASHDPAVLLVDGVELWSGEDFC